MITNAYALVENRSNVASEFSVQNVTLRAAGRDYLCCVSTTPVGTSTFGRLDSKVWDPVANAWVNLPQSPAATLEANNYASRVVKLQDGFIVVSPLNAGTIKSQRLRLTTGTGALAPFVDPVSLPITLTMDEGTSATLQYRILGDIPMGGVTVIVERSQGDGDIRVEDVDGSPISSAAITRTARIVSLTDADTTNDTATLRLRVVQSGGGLDPKAITIPVTVTDRTQVISHKPGDVNGDGVVNALDLDQVIENFGK